MVKALQASVVLLSSEPMYPVTVEGLKAANVVPTDWQHNEPIKMPMFSQIEFQNRVSIRIEAQRCIFQQNLSSELLSAYKIHALAQRYLKVMSLVPYTAIGINWQLEIEAENTSLWIGRNLANFQKLPGFVPTALKLVKPLEFAVCNIDVRSGRRVLVDCNYHFPIADKGVNSIITILEDWKKCQSHMSQVILPQLV